jgi:hypothetical protein
VSESLPDLVALGVDLPRARKRLDVEDRDFDDLGTLKAV